MEHILHLTKDQLQYCIDYREDAAKIKVKNKVHEMMSFLDHYGDESTEAIYSVLDNYVAKTESNNS